MVPPTPPKAGAAARQPRAARANATELRRIELVDTLAILELIRAKEPSGFDAAAVRWAGRLALERRELRLLKLGHAVRALSQLPGPAARRLLLALADPKASWPAAGGGEVGIVPRYRSQPRDQMRGG